MTDHQDRWVLQGADQLSPTFEAVGAAAQRAEDQIARFVQGSMPPLHQMQQQVQQLQVQVQLLSAATGRLPTNLPAASRPTTPLPPVWTTTTRYLPPQAPIPTTILPNLIPSVTQVLAPLPGAVTSLLQPLPGVVTQQLGSLNPMITRVFGPLPAQIQQIFAPIPPAATRILSQLPGLITRNLQLMQAPLINAPIGPRRPLINQLQQANVAPPLPPIQQATKALTDLDTELRQKPKDAQVAESALTKFFRNAASVATGNLIASAIGMITSRLNELGGLLKSAPENAEQWEATYIRIFGNVARAQAELTNVQQVAILSPSELPDIVALDQKLLEILGRPEQIQAKFGTSLPVIRKDILDTQAALGLTGDQAIQLVKDLQGLGSGETSQVFRSLIRTAGITKDELAQQGVEFDKNGSKIVSSYESAFTAVLKVMEQKYGGMGEIQSHTMQGMENNLNDFTRIAATHLGTPALADLESHLSSFLAKMSSPEAIAAFDLWGTRLEKLANLGFRVWDSFVRGVQIVLNVIKPLTDALGVAIDSLPSDLAAAAAQESNLAKAAGIAAANFQDGADATDAQATAMDALERRLIAIGNEKTAVHDRYDPEIQGLQAKETLLDRIYEKENRTNDLADAQRKLARDRIMAVDLYSSEGRSAAERLADDEKRVRDLQRQDAHADAKNQLADAKTLTEGKRDAALSALDHEQQAIETTKRLAAIAAEAHNRIKTALDGQSSATDTLTDKQKALIAMTEGERNTTRLAEAAAYNARVETGLGTAAFGGLLTMFQSIQTFLAGAWATTWAGMVDSFQRLPADLQGAWTALTRLGDVLMNSDHGLGVAFIQTKWAIITFFESASAATALIGPAIEGGVLGITKTLMHAALGLRRAQDFMHGIDTESDPDLQKMSGEADSIDTLYQAAMDKIKSNVTQGDVGAQIRDIFQKNAASMRNEVEDLRTPGTREVRQTATAVQDAVTAVTAKLDLGFGATPPPSPRSPQTTAAIDSDPAVQAARAAVGVAARQLQRAQSGTWGANEPIPTPAVIAEYRQKLQAAQMAQVEAEARAAAARGARGGPQGALTPQQQTQGLAALARQNGTTPAAGLGGSEFSGTITLVGLDSLGNEKFRELVHMNRTFINTEIAAGWGGH